MKLNGNSPAIGKNLGQIDLRGQTKVTIIAVLRDGDTYVNPGADYGLQENDTLVLLGESEKIEKAINVLQPGVNKSFAPPVPLP